jgi:hypothetical protein
MSHEIWRRVRRPFRYPSCRACVWEVYDVNQAGCLKCGQHHFCQTNSVDNKCPLIQCDDRTRVCNITGYVLPEVRHAVDEYCDTCDTLVYHQSDNKTRQSTPSQTIHDIDLEVFHVVSTLLLGQKALQCREQENAKQYARLSHHMHRQMKLFKLVKPGEQPNVCTILALAMAQEKYWRFIEEASEELTRHCSREITLCLLELKNKGVKITAGARLQDLVCGMLYMLKHGLTFQNRVLLAAIPEVDRCLPHENKIEVYFGISSKVICMTENEVKLIFREYYHQV